jgi:hypothetical protein
MPQGKLGVFEQVIFIELKKFSDHVRPVLQKYKIKTECECNGSET